MAILRLGVSGGSSILSAKVSASGASEIRSDRVGDHCMSAEGTISGGAGSGVTRGVGDEMMGMGLVRNSWVGMSDISICQMVIVWGRGVGSL